MKQGSDRTGPLRDRRAVGEQRVTPLELFFDLVYVFAITQLSHLLLAHPTVEGTLQTLFLLLVVWWAWQYTTWFTNWFDPEALPVRLVLVAVMLASLVMSVAIPEAFGERGLMFALAYVAIQVGRIAERCQLIVIIALGESILVTGTTFGEIEASAAAVLAFVVAFLGSAALWWIYFARSAHDASETMVRSEDPGRMARSAYTYFHLPIIAGIIAVAAADELVLAHPADPGTVASVSLILGGTALFVVGHGFFLWTASGRMPRSRFVAFVALTALAPVGLAVPALALSAAAALIVVLLAAWDATRSRRLHTLRGAST
jgi:low temperature requirement protein LtrA